MNKIDSACRKYTITPELLRELRKRRGESQFHFWSRFGITQSRGSRFETGTPVPDCVSILLTLFLDGIISERDLPLPVEAATRPHRK